MRHPSRLPNDTLQITCGVLLEAFRLAAALITVNGLLVLAWLCFGP